MQIDLILHSFFIICIVALIIGLILFMKRFTQPKDRYGKYETAFLIIGLISLILNLNIYISLSCMAYSIGLQYIMSKTIRNIKKSFIQYILSIILSVGLYSEYGDIKIEYQNIINTIYSIALLIYSFIFVIALYINNRNSLSKYTIVSKATIFNAYSKISYVNCVFICFSILNIFIEINKYKLILILVFCIISNLLILTYYMKKGGK